jgi:hypothetical protein
MLPPNRAFVVQFSDDTDPDCERVSGRAEHLESGRRCRFNSFAELHEFMKEALRDAAPDAVVNPTDNRLESDTASTRGHREDGDERERQGN